MEIKDEPFLSPHEQLGIHSFQQRFPWFGGDLQTLRDTFAFERLPLDKGKEIEIEVPALPSGENLSGKLLAFFNSPPDISKTKGLVLLLHGLGGSSRRLGLRRMAGCLIQADFAVLRLNLRGADPCRHLVGGTYAAECNSDLLPVLLLARQLCNQLSVGMNPYRGSIPLFGVGISLGGTILLNACLKQNYLSGREKPLLDGLVCTSSPLDLAACSKYIERPRNAIYQRWLLKRLVRQTISDPWVIDKPDNNIFASLGKGISPKTIREFDKAITAPRWGYKDVETYYLEASPLPKLCEPSVDIPPALLLQALDDPWVPSDAALLLKKKTTSELYSGLKVVVTKRGGHNGFHGISGCWGDLLVRTWLTGLSSKLC